MPGRKDRRSPRILYPALERALDAANWLEASDEGAKRAALLLADDLDRVTDVIRSIQVGSLIGDPKLLLEAVGKRAYLGSQLLAYLRELGLTVASRAERIDDGTDELSDLQEQIRESLRAV